MCIRKLLLVITNRWACSYQICTYGMVCHKKEATIMYHDRISKGSDGAVGTRQQGGREWEQEQERTWE